MSELEALCLVLRLLDKPEEWVICSAGSVLHTPSAGSILHTPTGILLKHITYRKESFFSGKTTISLTILSPELVIIEDIPLKTIEQIHKKVKRIMDTSEGDSQNNLTALVGKMKSYLGASK